MNFTLTERVLILNELLPKFSTKEEIAVAISISAKMTLTAEEQQAITMETMRDGTKSINVSPAFQGGTNEYIFSDEELLLLKKRVEYIDRNGMFSMYNYATYMQILGERTSAIPSHASASLSNQEGVKESLPSQGEHPPTPPSKGE